MCRQASAHLRGKKAAFLQQHNQMLFSKCAHGGNTLIKRITLVNSAGSAFLKAFTDALELLRENEWPKGS